ncbi:MAG: phosphohistidine phosphatase SixA [Candidatus Sumerlaeota bacterium]|nr:phosphohistidine phosphatase SixA [Candidatus Sumerlaeota bacterium]
MEIYLLRHAIAANRDPGKYPRDEDRPLTGRGAARQREAALGMARLGLEFDRIVASPLARARQTAEIVADVLRAKDKLEINGLLGFEFSMEALDRWLSGMPADSRILLVGHEPDMGELAAHWTGANPLPFKKGALCKIVFSRAPEARGGAIEWFLEPGHLRAIGGAAE